MTELGRGRGQCDLSGILCSSCVLAAEERFGITDMSLFAVKAQSVLYNVKNKRTKCLNFFFFISFPSSLYLLGHYVIHQLSNPVPSSLARLSLLVVVINPQTFLSCNTFGTHKGATCCQCIPGHLLILVRILQTWRYSFTAPTQYPFRVALVESVMQVIHCAAINSEKQ